tara:strand:+ start:826 stop:1299 length:474 start_codon:yes stop_codon:yes gene_type:complete
VVEPGEEFEVYQGDDSPLRWVTCDDDAVTNLWVLYNGEFFPTSDRLERNQQMKRKVEYGSIEDQMDMMYWDQVNGTTTWKDHVSAVKANIVNQATADADANFYAGKKEFEMGTEEAPAWNGLPAEKRQKVTKFKNATTYEPGWELDPATNRPRYVGT